MEVTVVGKSSTARMPVRENHQHPGQSSTFVPCAAALGGRPRPALLPGSLPDFPVLTSSINHLLPELRLQHLVVGVEAPVDHE